MSIIDELPTSQVCEIVRRLRPRLYIDFFQYLPAEVCLKILGFLDPVSLVNTARASREWMVLALDRKLWEQLYILEGFRVTRSEVQRFEDTLNTDRPRSSGHLEDEHASKKRATPQRILPALHADGDSEMMDAEPLPMQKQESIFGPLAGGRMPKQSRSRPDTDMTYQENIPPIRSPKATQFPTCSVNPQFPLQDRTNNQDRSNNRLSTTSTYSRYTSPLSNISSLVVLDRSDKQKKLNWQYLYSQRRRLEANWEDEKYTNFQLPHPQHPEEAHEECIYTIQHSGKYLVSGSRDRTLRIWDLDTRRLVRPPLRAHVGSVLCLQFDADPDEDLIVSGSSDATVVLWKFSTGQIIQRLRKAHRESVLNVRFDKRVLVTCSKDKTIKIFNRRAMSPGDLGYPDLSHGVNPVPTYLNNYGFNPAPSAGLPIKQPYSMIGCLEGHGAAVNAVQIHGDEVVSASGDRTVKVWNWVDQTCTRTLIGHTKGIACVQYDGRRIVSGSSDNEVKVFDKESGLEVASLRAHTNLVRTVQAGFGDLPYSAEEDKEDAKMIDHEYFKAVDAGVIPKTVQLHRGRPRNAGSKKPEDITAYGAKLPPGGGGGKFGRIVSGSYDETIIIWRRDKEGVWKAQHTLRQEEAAHSASRTVQDNEANEASTSTVAPQSSSQQTPTEASDVDAPTEPFAPGTASFYRHLIDITLPQGPVAFRHALQAHPQVLTYSAYLGQEISDLPPPIQQVMNYEVQRAVTAQQLLPGGNSDTESSHAALAAGQGGLSSQAGPSTQNLVTAQPSSADPPTQTPAPQLTPAQTAVQTTMAAAAANLAAQAAQVAAIAAPPHHAPPHHHLPANMARVFKLQFDARRIICCSQTSVIVGWDFANGDEQIIEASQFFAPIE
jgi:F-box and WD-40 domain protein 1/11